MVKGGSKYEVDFCLSLQVKSIIEAGMFEVHFERGLGFSVGLVPCRIKMDNVTWSNAIVCDLFGIEIWRHISVENCPPYRNFYASNKIRTRTHRASMGR